MLQECYNDRELSCQLRNLIRESGHNVSSFAKDIGYPESTIRALCDPRKPFNPKTKTLVFIAKELDVTVSDLLRVNERD